jgi:hypothetical protein
MGDKSDVSTAPLGDAAVPVGVAPPANPLVEIREAVAKATEPVCPTAILPVRQSSRGGSGAFLVVADDGKRYWCKVVENGQSTRVPLNEQLVGRLGRRIGAAVCEVSLIKIPTALAGWEFMQGMKLKAGYAHASMAVDPAIETRSLGHPLDDDNPTRHASLGILADWCWASDTQWLYAPTDENRYYSHDHGYYFPGGPDWTIASLRASRADARPGFPAGLWAPGRVAKVIQELESLDVIGIARIVGGMPASWPITEDELVDMVLFLEKRRVAVLERAGKTLASPGGTST